MLFNSIEFILFFLPITVLVFYFACHKNHKIGMLATLLFASLFFYGFWYPPYLILLIFSILINFSASLIVDKFRAAMFGRATFNVGVIFNIFLLAFFKYTAFLLESISKINWVEPIETSILLPLAISFFTFQQIGYLTEVYRSKPPEKNLLQYALFVSFFPQLIAGPIVQHHHVSYQFENIVSINSRLWLASSGLILFAIGLSKKLLLADTLAKTANRVFDGVANGSNVSFWEAWLGTFSYSFQIYFDFSGYSDMAIGLGLIFGICLPINFLSPYKSTSIIEFWRSWHITLSKFLRDYLYIPLGGKGESAIFKHRNIMITMILGGLWHGAGFTFLLWGLLHGLLIAVNHLYRDIFYPDAIKPKSFKHFCCVTLTFLLVTISWVFFRSTDLDFAIKILEAMFQINALTLPLSLKPLLGEFALFVESTGILFIGFSPNQLIKTPFEMLGVLVLAAIIIWCSPSSSRLILLNLPGYEHLQKNMDQKQTKKHPVESKKWAFITGSLIALCLLSLNKPSEFIYFNF